MKVSEPEVIRGRQRTSMFLLAATLIAMTGCEGNHPMVLLSPNEAAADTTLNDLPGHVSKQQPPMITDPEDPWQP